MNLKVHLASDEYLGRFIQESNWIESIQIEGDGLQAHIDAYRSLIIKDAISVEELSQFVAAIAPGNRLRKKHGENVVVGAYWAPRGGPKIQEWLKELLLDEKYSAYELYCRYLELHPFTDGNGRSGRLLWLHRTYHGPHEGLRMAKTYSFLENFHYHTLGTHYSNKNFWTKREKMHEAAAPYKKRVRVRGPLPGSGCTVQSFSRR